ncbi:MAG: glycosyltransferase [Alphaproteobacteria bacterium]|nr:glycosyltransferase [Alphaproteobacteria bacterium]
MKILQVLAGAKHGGAETACIDMCVALSEAGQNVEVATRQNDIRVPRLRAAGIKVHILPFGGKIDIYTPFALRGIIKEFQPDIVQTWMSRAAQKVTRWTPAMGIPQYLVVSRLGGYYKIKNFKQTDYFTTITPKIREYLIKNGVDPQKVLHINNFAETEQIEAPIKRDAEGIPKHGTLCVSLGRLHESKAFDFLIEAVADLQDVYLWIAGEGPDRENLEKQIQALGVQNRIKLLGWRSDRAALLQAADICIFPSRYEPFGTVFVQAWGNKTPLITTATDGPKQFVEHGKDGLVTQIDDADSMQKAISRLISEPYLREKLVENGFNKYLQGFTKERTVKSYLDFYAEILKTERGKNALKAA